MKEATSAQARAGSRVGSCGHMTQTRHLDGGFPGALVRLYPVRPEDVALGQSPALAVSEERVLGRSDLGWRGASVRSCVCFVRTWAG